MNREGLFCVVGRGFRFGFDSAWKRTKKRTTKREKGAKNTLSHPISILNPTVSNVSCNGG